MKGVATAVVAAIIIGTLYFEREVFVPIALAILLSFVLAPLVRLLQRWRLPRGLSVVGVLLAFVSIFALGGVIATQVTELAGDLPRYQFDARKDQVAARYGGTERDARACADVLHDLGKELNKPKEPAAGPPASLQTPAPAPEARPIPVEVRQPPPTALESIAALISPLLHPLTTTGIIAIFVIFILLQREDLRNRFIKLAGSHDLQKTTAALDDAATRLSRLFLIQLAVNAAFGVVIGAGLWIIGVPQSDPMGNSRRHSALRALYRRRDRGRVSAHARSRGGPRLVDAAVDGGALPGGRAGGRPRDRAAALWAQHRPIAGGGGDVGDVLDGAVGPRGARSRHALDRVPGGARPASSVSSSWT